MELWPYQQLYYKEHNHHDSYTDHVSLLKLSPPKKHELSHSLTQLTEGKISQSSPFADREAGTEFITNTTNFHTAWTHSCEPKRCFNQTN